MSKERWKVGTWGDLGVLEYGRALRDYRDSNGPVRVFGTNGPIGWTRDSLGKGPAVIIGRKGAYRGVHYSLGPFWVIDTAFWFRPVVDMDPRWAYYQMLTQDINGRDSGSAIPSLSRTDFASLKLLVPSLPEQRAIAEVLGALDDKIEANWRVAGVSRELAAALLDSVLSRAALGGALEEVNLGEVASVNARQARPDDGMIRYLDISAVGDGVASEPTLMRWTAAPSRARRHAGHGDTLWSTVRPNRRSHCLVLDPPPNLVASTGFAVVTPTAIGPSLLYGLLDRPEFEAYLVSVADGSAYPAVRADRFTDATIQLPPAGEREAYETATLPLRERAFAAERESIVLDHLREALLPKLLSGELRVRDVEAVVEEAVCGPHHRD